MSRVDRGWFIIRREHLSGHIGHKNGVCLAIWVWLNGRANYQATLFRHGGGPKRLERGSLLTSEREIAEALGFSRSAVSRHLKYLEDSQEIAIKSSRRGTRIKVINYEEYQNFEANLASLTPPNFSENSATNRTTENEDKKTTGEATHEATGEATDGATGKATDEATDRATGEALNNTILSNCSNEGTALTPEEEINGVSINGNGLDFDALYEIFPKRGKDMQKSLGMKRCRAQIKTFDQYERLKKAVLNYIQHVKEQKQKDPSWSYGKQWGTFMSPTYWIDWVNVNGHSKNEEIIICGRDETCKPNEDSIL